MLRIVLSFCLLGATAPAASPIAAGRWEVTNNLQEVFFDGRRDDAVMPASKPQAVCLSSAQALKGPGVAFSDPELCQVETSSIEGASFAYTLKCKATESDDMITTKAAGTFVADSYTGSATLIQQRGSMRIEMRSKVNAKRVGDC